jgi:hypothetical protein
LRVEVLELPAVEARENDDTEGSVDEVRRVKVTGGRLLVDDDDARQVLEVEVGNSGTRVLAAFGIEVGPFGFMRACNEVFVILDAAVRVFSNSVLG